MSIEHRNPLNLGSRPNGSLGRRKDAVPHSIGIWNHIEKETLSAHRGRKIMETKLERISQLSKENPNMVCTSIGHLININREYT